MNSTIDYNFKNITMASSNPKPRKGYDWLDRIAEVNAAARAAGETYGRYVARLRAIRLAESNKMKIPEGYKTAREGAYEKRLKGFTLEAVLAASLNK